MRWSMDFIWAGTFHSNEIADGNVRCVRQAD